MPRIQYLSDVHRELLLDETLTVSKDPTDRAAVAHRMALTGDYPVFWLPATNADVVVLAGDIDVGVRGVEWAAIESQLLGKPIIYVPGNHEYYGKELRATLRAMRDRAAGTNVHVLDCDEVTLDGTRFLGATLWTDYRANEPATPAANAMQAAQQQINDHRRIRFGDKDRLFTPDDALRLHQEAKAWLTTQLSKPHQGRTVVVTHHGPSPACQHPDYPVDPISAAFHSNLESLMGPHVDLWIYGHTHACLDVIVRETRLVSNQKGYPREIVQDYDPNRVVQI